MVGGFIAAAIVTLVQFARVRDRRLLLLAAMFALQSQALGRQWYDAWRDLCQAGVCVAGLALMFTLTPGYRSSPPSTSRSPSQEKNA